MNHALKAPAWTAFDSLPDGDKVLCRRRAEAIIRRYIYSNPAGSLLPADAEDYVQDALIALQNSKTQGDQTLYNIKSWKDLSNIIAKSACRLASKAYKKSANRKGIVGGTQPLAADLVNDPRESGPLSASNKLSPILADWILDSIIDQFPDKKSVDYRRALQIIQFIRRDLDQTGLRVVEISRIPAHSPEKIAASLGLKARQIYPAWHIVVALVKEMDLTPLNQLIAQYERVFDLERPDWFSSAVAKSIQTESNDNRTETPQATEEPLEGGELGGKDKIDGKV